MRNFRRVVVPFTLLLVTITAMAQEATSPGDESQVLRLTLPTQPLMDLIEQVEKKSGKSFLIAGHVPAEVVTGTTDLKDLDYAALLAILQNNGFGAVAVGEFTNIVSLPAIRMYDLPLLHEDDASVAQLEWVTRIVRLQHASAKELVPVVRPLLIQAGHIAAIQQSNSILIVERYSNAKRIAEILQTLDEMAAEGQ